MVVCLPGTKIVAITKRVEINHGSGEARIHFSTHGTNNAEREGTTAIMRK